MREIVYLICDSGGVREMKKRPPAKIGRHEVCVKMTVVIPNNAFNPNSLEATVDVKVPETNEEAKARAQFYAEQEDVALA